MTVVCLSSNTAWSLYNYRRGLIRALLEKGWRVVTLAPHDTHSARLADLGCEVIDLPMDNQGTHPLRDLALLLAYRRLYARLAPTMALHYTIKPVIYGGMAAAAAGVAHISIITGLGAAFARDGWLRWVVEQLYRRSQHRAERVFFLNEDDRRMFVGRRLAPAEVMEQLPGEGVDLDHFSPQAWPEGTETRFLLLARMLWNKGIGEFVEAARRIRQQHPDCRFQLLGAFGIANPAAMSRAHVDEWVAGGAVEYLGAADDVRPFIAQAHCVVLPSYYGEGVPRALLEAAAMGRPVITTDHVGCRDAVADGRSGLLCQPRSVDSLTAAMARFLAAGRPAQQAMGAEGRRHVEHTFDEGAIIARYLELIEAAARTTSRAGP